MAARRLHRLRVSQAEAPAAESVALPEALEFLSTRQAVKLGDAPLDVEVERLLEVFRRDGR